MSGEFCKNRLRAAQGRCCGRWRTRTRELADSLTAGITFRKFAEGSKSVRVGCPRTTVQDILTEIKEFKIPSIPGIFTEDKPEDGVAERVLHSQD